MTMRQIITRVVFKFFYNSSSSAKLWQNPASIDIHWLQTATIWQKMTNCRKTQTEFVFQKPGRLIKSFIGGDQSSFS